MGLDCPSMPLKQIQQKIRENTSCFMGIGLAAQACSMWNSTFQGSDSLTLMDGSMGKSLNAAWVGVGPGVLQSNRSTNLAWFLFPIEMSTRGFGGPRKNILEKQHLRTKKMQRGLFIRVQKS